MPYARRNIDSPNMSESGGGLPELVHSGYLSGVRKQNNGRSTFQNKEGLCLRRIAVPMGTNIGVPKKYIQKPLRILGSAFVEIVVHPQAGRLIRFPSCFFKQIFCY